MADHHDQDRLDDHHDHDRRDRRRRVRAAAVLLAATLSVTGAIAAVSATRTVGQDGPETAVPRADLGQVVDATADGTAASAAGTSARPASTTTPPSASAEPSQGRATTAASPAVGGTMSRRPLPTRTWSPSLPTPTGCADDQIGTAPDCVAAPPAPTASGKTWTLPFREEFAGSTWQNGKVWPCFDWAGSLSSCNDSFNQGREHYQASQVQVSNGSAKLIAAPLSPPWKSAGCQTGQCTYKSGMLSTSRTPDTGGTYLYGFTYGYVESRIKFPATQGFFTAFWMLPTDPSFSYTAEIDIAEILGDDPNTVYMNYHYGDRAKNYTANSGKRNNGACDVKNFASDWVTLGLDWQPNHIAWYINGTKCGQFNGSSATIYNGPMQLILNLMVDVQWQRDWQVGLKDPTLTRQLEVDYIRVFQQR